MNVSDKQGEVYYSGIGWRRYAVAIVSETGRCRPLRIRRDWRS